jgi:hypothetical protein
VSTPATFFTSPPAGTNGVGVIEFGANFQTEPVPTLPT